MTNAIILEVIDLKKHYKKTKAVDSTLEQLFWEVTEDD